MAESILVVEGVTKTYPGVKALDNVSLEFRKGEIHALVGENGAGKSTIIKTIAGAIKPDCGSVLFEGKDLTKMKTSEIRGCGVEVVYQEFNLALQLPVYENIFIGNLAGKRSVFSHIYFPAGPISRPWNLLDRSTGIFSLPRTIHAIFF